MNIISFAWTTPAIQARRKTRTRRHWSASYAAKFRENSICQGYDRGPRVGGKPIHLIRLVRAPWIQNTSEMTAYDYEAEGFAYMDEQHILFRGKTCFQFFDEWIDAAEDLYVVDFSYVWDMAFDRLCAYREAHNHAVACGVADERPKLPRPLGQMCAECKLDCARVDLR
ncbi:MAG: hypothetical protein WC455_13365 [Dehalococcoidia bacterium]|jgi:hypothetical protein